MSKLLVLLMLVVGLSANDCKEFSSHNVVEDRKEAKSKWGSNSKMASHYATRAIMNYQLEMNCLIHKKLDAIEFKIESLKHSKAQSYSEPVSMDTNLGTGY